MDRQKKRHCREGALSAAGGPVEPVTGTAPASEGSQPAVRDRAENAWNVAVTFVVMLKRKGLSTRMSLTVMLSE